MHILTSRHPIGSFLSNLSLFSIQAAKVAFPELSFRECMYLGGFEDEELETIIGPQKVRKSNRLDAYDFILFFYSHTGSFLLAVCQWRTYYVTLKDRLRETLKVFHTRTKKSKAHLNREALVSILRSEDAERLTKVFRDRAGLFEGFMENAAERRRDGIDPDNLRELRKGKGVKRKRDVECEQEAEQDDEEEMVVMEEDEEASDIEEHSEYEQEDPDQGAHDIDGQHYQQHLPNWQS